MTTTNYDIDYFHYTRSGFNYILDIKEYRFNHNGSIKTITENCVNNYLRIPRKLNPVHLIYNLTLEISEDAEDAYLLVSQVLLPQYFPSFPDIIADIKNPTGLWMYTGENKAGRIPGTKWSPKNIFSNVKDAIYNANQIYKANGAYGLYDYIMDDFPKYNYLESTLLTYKRDNYLQSTTGSDNVVYLNHDSMPVYQFFTDHDYEATKSYFGNNHPFFEFEFEKYNFPRTLTLEQVKSNKGFVGELEYQIVERSDGGYTPDEFVFADDYLCHEYIHVFFPNYKRKENNSVNHTAAEIAQMWIDCINNDINNLRNGIGIPIMPNSPSDRIPEIISILTTNYLNGASFSSIDLIQQIINMTVVERGTYFNGLIDPVTYGWSRVSWSDKLEPVFPSSDCSSMIFSLLPSNYNYSVYANGYLGNSPNSTNSINKFNLTYESKISNAPDTWNKYTPYMTASLMLPTFEKEKKLKDINKMKIKDIYALYRSEDNFNIKNYYNYISKLRDHLRSLGFETYDYIHLNYENIKTLEPKFENTNVFNPGFELVSELNIVEDYTIDEIISKWNQLLIDFKSQMKKNLISFSKKYEASDLFIINNIDKMVEMFTVQFENNTFFYPENISNLINNTCKYSSYTTLKSHDIFKTFYLDIFCFHPRVYSANFEITQTFINSNNIDSYIYGKPTEWEGNENYITYVMSPFINTFQSSDIYSIIDKDYFLLKGLNKIYNLIKGTDLKITRIENYNSRGIDEDAKIK